MSVWIKKKQCKNQQSRKIISKGAKSSSYQQGENVQEASSSGTLLLWRHLLCVQLAGDWSGGVVMAGGGVGAMLRTRVLPVCLPSPSCPALWAPTMGWLHPWSLDRQFPTGTKLLTKVLLHLHSMKQALLRWCASRHLMLGSLPSSLGARC